ncbi:MAG: recombinase family protein [Lachnospiraceae bacterium]|nr:recombinase family protein [Lachnospiraceae bacterium]
MKTAAAYIRVSTDDQIEYSPTSQLEKIQEYAKRNGYVLPVEYVYVDEGISGRHTQKRAAFNKMIGTAKQKPKPFDAILLWKFSRFARNREDSIVYKSMLRKQCGIDVISISENVGDDKMSVLIEALIEAMDEYYSINLGEEVKRGMTEKAGRGEVVTIPSFGYLIENGRYIPDPAAAPALRKIFDDFLKGTPLRTIAINLNDNGFRTRRGNLFENRTIRYILNNPVYVGKIRWTPTGRTRRDFDNPDTMVIDGKHEPLIDIETWNAVQQRLSEMPKTKYMREKSPNEPFMLQGLVRCSNCGATLCQAVKGKSLQCYSYAHGKCKVSHSISIKKINGLFLNALNDSAMTGDFKLEIKPKITDTKNENIPAKIERERVKLKRIKNAYEDGVYTLEEFKESKNAVEEKIKALEATLSSVSVIDPQTEIKKLKNKVINIIPSLKSPDVPEADKNGLIKSFVEHIVFYRASCDIDIFFRT